MADGALFKMGTQHGSPVQYTLPVGDARIPINPLIGQEIELSWGGKITCSHCGVDTPKSYSQGHCFTCARTLARCDLCIVRPETCHYAAGTCREPAWGEAHCLIPHIVYLANSAGLKVGITRGTQIPTRWIDQGAEAAIPLFEVSSRLTSGKVESALKDFVSDRTNWRRMLGGPAATVDLLKARDALLAEAEAPLDALMASLPAGSIRPLTQAQPTEIAFPIEAYPPKVKSLNLEKTPNIRGPLLGVKGQYLLFPQGAINIRKYIGYEVSFGPVSG